MNDKPITVYPAADETDDDIEVPEFRTDENDSLSIKSENVNDSESNNHLGLKKMTADRRPSRFGSVVSAIRIAKWMARAYGYASQKKSLYVSQDVVISENLFS